MRPLAGGDAAALFEARSASREALRRRLGWAAEEPTLKAAADFVAACRKAAKAGEALTLGIFEAKDGALAGVASLGLVLYLLTPDAGVGWMP